MTHSSGPPNPPDSNPEARACEDRPSAPSQARILRELVDELKMESAPSVDWDRVERGLMDRIEGSEAHVDAPDVSAQVPDTWVSQGLVSQGLVSQGLVSQGSVERAVSSKPSRTSARRAVRRKPRVEAAPGPAPGSERRATRRQLAHWHVAVAAAVVLFVAFGTLWRMELTAPEVILAQDGVRSSDPAVRSGDLARLRAGDIVEATDGSVVYEAPGVVRWTLAAGGRLSVKQAVDAKSHVLTLERGSIRAEVNPAATRIHRTAGDVVERFAVEVDGTRVAVRGTVFTVTRTTAGMVVSVERGTVAVGQIGSSGLTEGRLLVAPARQSFGIDGTLASRPVSDPDGIRRNLLEPEAGLLEPEAGLLGPEAGLLGPEAGLLGPGEGQRPMAEAPGSSGPQASKKPSVPRAALATRDEDGNTTDGSSPLEASGQPRLLTAARIHAGLLKCFERTYQASSSRLGLSVSSTFHVTVDREGAVSAARFVPPVRADLARCAGSVIIGKFASGPEQLSVPIQYDVGTTANP